MSQPAECFISGMAGGAGFKGLKSSKAPSPPWRATEVLVMAGTAAQLFRHDCKALAAWPWLLTAAFILLILAMTGSGGSEWMGSSIPWPETGPAATAATMVQPIKRN